MTVKSMTDSHFSDVPAHSGKQGLRQRKSGSMLRDMFWCYTRLRPVAPKRLAPPYGQGHGRSQARTDNQLYKSRKIRLYMNNTDNSPGDNAEKTNRKKLPPEAVRSCTVTTKVTAAEREKIHDIAAGCNLTPSDYMRQRALGYEPPAALTSEESALLRNLDGCRVDILNFANARFKASELGKGRNLMASKLEGTWNKLHPNQERQTKADSRESDIRPDYTSYRPDTRRVEFEHESNSYTRFIPEKVMQVFDDEFDSREMDNWADLINEACYHFAVAMGYMAFLNTPTYVSGGGGASNNDLPKKRDDLEEEIARARRCAATARSKIGIIRKRGFRR